VKTPWFMRLSAVNFITGTVDGKTRAMKGLMQKPVLLTSSLQFRAALQMQRCAGQTQQGPFGACIY
jgi:hypothetical protein